MAKDTQSILVPQGTKFQLKDYKPNFTNGMESTEARERMVSLRTRVAELQDELYADGRYGLLIVLQGMDASGKDGAANSVFRETGPVGCSVTAFGVPSEEESKHDYLWRIHHAMPERGKVVIFNRSHYESVLVEKVRGFTPKDRCEARYEEINQFERMLTREGTVILKFFIHISEDEQREQLQQRIDDPTKHWKFRKGDLDDRALWGDYMAAYEEMVSRCNTEWAPWYVVPSNHRWFRDVVLAEAIIDRLEKLQLRFPPGEPGLDGLKIK